VYNPLKNVVYWFGTSPPLPWLLVLGCQVAVERNLSKLLGTPFGLSLDVSDIDKFLFQKIQKKL
jgi:hypothetical protein